MRKRGSMFLMKSPPPGGGKAPQAVQGGARATVSTHPQNASRILSFFRHLSRKYTP